MLYIVAALGVVTAASVLAWVHALLRVRDIHAQCERLIDAAAQAKAAAADAVGAFSQKITQANTDLDTYRAQAADLSAQALTLAQQVTLLDKEAAVFRAAEAAAQITARYDAEQVAVRARKHAQHTEAAEAAVRAACFTCGLNPDEYGPAYDLLHTGKLMEVVHTAARSLGIDHNLRSVEDVVEALVWEMDQL